MPLLFATYWRSLPSSDLCQWALCVWKSSTHRPPQGSCTAGLCQGLASWHSAPVGWTQGSTRGDMVTPTLPPSLHTPGGAVLVRQQLNSALYFIQWFIFTLSLDREGYVPERNKEGESPNCAARGRKHVQGLAFLWSPHAAWGGVQAGCLTTASSASLFMGPVQSWAHSLLLACWAKEGHSSTGLGRPTLRKKAAPHTNSHPLPNPQGLSFQPPPFQTHSEAWSLPHPVSLLTSVVIRLLIPWWGYETSDSC